MDTALLFQSAILGLLGGLIGAFSVEIGQDRSVLMGIACFAGGEAILIALTIAIKSFF